MRLTTTYLPEAIKNSPLAILDNRIYRLSNRGSDRLIYINFDGSIKSLIEGEMLVTLENRLMHPFLITELANAQDRLDNEIKSSDNGLKEIKKERNPIEKFIKSFIESYHHLDEEAAKKREKQGNYEEPIPPIPTEIAFHQTDAKEPVISRCIKHDGLLIINNQIYNVIKGDNSKNRLKIVKQGEVFSIEYNSPFAEFEQQYIANLNLDLEETVEFIDSLKRERLAIHIRRNKRETQTFEIPQENKTNEVGWLKDERGNYFLYKNQSSFEMYSSETKKRFRFPSFILGVMLIIKDGKVTYDSSLGIRILKAKGIRNGEDTEPMQSMYGKHYIHPATNFSGEYTGLCHGTYTYPTPSSGKLLDECIKQVFTEVIHLMQDGYRDKGAPDRKNNVYRYFDVPSDYDKYFTNHEIRS